jgi:hypothetical protein
MIFQCDLAKEFILHWSQRPPYNDLLVIIRVSGHLPVEAEETP